MDIEMMEARSRLVTSTRDFFLSRGYLETDTPTLSPSLIPESCLEVFETKFVHPFRVGFPLYLVPSPEVWMKRIIAATGRNVFQLCKTFRNAESIGRIHNPEFTMLEYYTVGADSHDNIELTEEYFRALAGPDTPEHARPPFCRLTMAEAFREFAGIDLEEMKSPDDMIAAARSRQLMVSDDAPWDDAFNAVFLTLVEPFLPIDKPLVLDEYPAQVECLARVISGTSSRERWELYARGIEIANCYTEEGNPESIKRYFESQAGKKTGALVPHAIDMDYARLFEGFPACSGVAIGFDRLAMVLLGKKDIAEVMAFPFTEFMP